MLAELNQHCCPDTMANAFMTLMSLFNDIEGDSKPIIELHSCFDDMVMDMSRCKIVILLILFVMFFLCTLYGVILTFLNSFTSISKCLRMLMLTTWSKMSVTMTVPPLLVQKSLLPLRGLGFPKILLLMPIIKATSGTILLSGS